MLLKFFYILILLLISFGCKQTASNIAENTVEEIVSQKITENDLSSIKFTEFVLGSEGKSITTDWVEYNQLDEQITYIKKGDLNYFKDNNEAIDALIVGLTKNIPEDLNNNSIVARLRTLETKTRQLESMVNLSTTSKDILVTTIKEFLIAMSNLNLQINKTIELEKQNIVKP